MRVLIVTPQAGGVVTGNRCSAEQWRVVMVGLGHEVEVASRFENQDAHLLIALHAERSASSVAAFRKTAPTGKIVVVLTGTDIYPEPSAVAIASMHVADRLVALQSRALERLPPDLHSKVRMILQAAGPIDEPAASPDADAFVVALVANLRAVKDPLRPAIAARLLPEDSKVQILHAGAALDPKYEDLARREMIENSRYRWLGSLDPVDAQGLIAGADLMVLSSLSEGAGRVVGEAVVAGTPVISSHIDGVVGLLGEDYPGYFPAGDSSALAALLSRAETDADFFASLEEACRAVAPQFAPAQERLGWQKLIGELA